MSNSVKGHPLKYFLCRILNKLYRPRGVLHTSREMISILCDIELFIPLEQTDFMLNYLLYPPQRNCILEKLTNRLFNFQNNLTIK